MLHVFVLRKLPKVLTTHLRVVLAPDHRLRYFRKVVAVAPLGGVSEVPILTSLAPLTVLQGGLLRLVELLGPLRVPRKRVLAHYILHVLVISVVRVFCCSPPVRLRWLLCRGRVLRLGALLRPELVLRGGVLLGTLGLFAPHGNVGEV